MSLSYQPHYDPTDDDRAEMRKLLDRHCRDDRPEVRTGMALRMAHQYLSDVSALPGEEWAARAVRRARVCLDYHMENR